MKHIVVVGGGPAGLMAAVSARRISGPRDLEITVIDKNERPARKLMITGKGRCNVTNNCDLSALISNVISNGKFLYSAFSEFSSVDTMNFFESCGVPLKTERGGRVFPVSDKASDIVDALVNSNKSGGNKIVCGKVTEILSEEDRVVGVRLSDGRTINADAVIVATGGMSYPLTGSTGDGYVFAAAAGHKVAEPRPALVPLECHEGFCTKLSGLTLKNVNLSVFDEKRKKTVFSKMGEMLFTHFGISGPLVLTASSLIGDPKKESYTAIIDLKPALTHEQLDRRILRDFSVAANKDIANVLTALLPKSLVPAVLGFAAVPPHTKVNSVTRNQRRELCEVIKNFKLHIIGFRPVEEAIVTRGGVSVKEIEPSSMRSRLKNGLFFAGEVIDVDACTGGYNLQIAFSTGFAAGKAAAQK